MSKEKPFAVGFVDDRWEAGVAGLSHEAEYVYFRLCKTMWATGEGVHPDDVTAVCRFYRGVKKALVELERKGKLQLLGGRWINERAIAEHARAKESQSTNTRRGRDAALTRWAKHKHGSRNAQASPEHTSGNSHPDPNPNPCRPTTQPNTSSQPNCPASAQAREVGAPAAGADEAGRVVQAFDAAGQRHFGQVWRAWPTGTDHGTARAMLEAGADLTLCAAAFDTLLGGMAVKGQSPPRSLAYAKGAVADAIEAARQGLPPPRPAGQQVRPPQESTEERLARIARNVERGS
jgi:uncharacterized protein YdaU (DUF1376 family)